MESSANSNNDNSNSVTSEQELLYALEASLAKDNLSIEQTDEVISNIMSSSPYVEASDFFSITKKSHSFSAEIKAARQRLPRQEKVYRLLTSEEFVSLLKQSETPNDLKSTIKAIRDNKKENENLAARDTRPRSHTR